MAAYNESAGITSSIQSVIAQTYTNWELIIIDDASIDDTCELIREHQGKDNRIKLIENEKNIGLANCLNKGIKESKGKYIARLDADDICFPDRFELQINFMIENTEVDVLGGNALLVDEKYNAIRETNMPITHEEIEDGIIKKCPLIHPTVLYKKKFIEELNGYDSTLRKKQDYDLWFRGVKKYKYANLEHTLIKYKTQRSKPIKTDLYGFYVRLINSFRQKKYIVGVYWALVTLGVNLLCKFGYKHRSHRNN